MRLKSAVALGRQATKGDVVPRTTTSPPARSLDICAVAERRPTLRIAMHRTVAVVLLAGLAVAMPLCGAGESEKFSNAKEALQELQLYIGGWKGNGSSERDKSSLWKESAEWSWRFKGKDIFLSVDMGASKLF